MLTAQNLLRETGLSARYRLHRQQPPAGGPVYSARFGSVDPYRKWNYLGGSGLTSKRLPHRVRYRIGARPSNKRLCRRVGSVPLRRTSRAEGVGSRSKTGSYGSFASFQDPDGNSWLLQEITTRLPGREWKQTRRGPSDVGNLARLLQGMEEHHGNYEKTHAKHNWWDWYAAYLSARQTGSSPDDATVAADRYMDDVHHIPLR